MVPSHGRNKPLKPTARKSTSGAHHALEKEYGDIRRFARLDFGEFEGTIIVNICAHLFPHTKYDIIFNEFRLLKNFLINV